MLFDTHCHLHDPKAFPDPDETLRSARQVGVERLVVVGTCPEDWTRAIDFAERRSTVRAIVGWHPNYTADYEPESLRHLETLLAHPSVLAIGEIGLDYHWDYAPREKQFAALEAGLDLAVRLGLPVVFHAREAYSDLLTVLEKRPPHAYLFHCWAGSTEEAARASALDAYFGVDGPITYPKAEALREVVSTLPRERIVIETDSPYMAPAPYRGKPNQPAYVAQVNDGLAKTLGITPEACAELTTANACRFFRWPIEEATGQRKLK